MPWRFPGLQEGGGFDDKRDRPVRQPRYVDDPELVGIKKVVSTNKYIISEEGTIRNVKIIK